MSTPADTVFLVDDDPAVQKALARVLRAEGWSVETFDSAEAFLARSPPDPCGCLVLDVTMPGLDGIALQRRLADEGRSLPTVFVTGHGDIPMSVQAIKAGAADFLTKPVEAKALVAAIRVAITQAAQTRSQRADAELLQKRFGSLTPREREVLAALAAGRLNKQIAADLGVVEQTVKFHRARIMERMQARTTAELMHSVARLGLGTSSTGTGGGSAPPRSDAPKPRQSYTKVD